MHAYPFKEHTVAASLIHGAVELEATQPTQPGLLPQRLPAWARRQSSDPQLAMAVAQPAGVRLVFDTAATWLELDTVPTKRDYVGMPARPDGVYDLLVDGRLAQQASAPSGTILRIDMAAGTSTLVPGEVQTLRFTGLAGHVKRVEIWLPHDETTVLVALRSDAPLQAVAARQARRWLHHGSSISQGSNASHPSGTWPALAAAHAGVDLLNLGFGGSALLDPFTARTMRDLPADIISVKIGINLVNTDAMRLRAFGPAVHGFLDTIRDGHPHTPLLVVSPVYCGMHEDVPGPTLFDTTVLKDGRIAFRAAGRAAETAQGKLTLNIIREQLGAIVQARRADDMHLHYLDGRELYGAADSVDLPLPDGLHPGPAAQRLMGERFAALLAVKGL